MVTYEFYKDSYLGSAIPENAFSGVAARAEAALAYFKRIYQVSSEGETTEQLALCAMAEAIYAQRGRKSGIASERVGRVSVRYYSGSRVSRELERELYRRASIYLEIYRGVE